MTIPTPYYLLDEKKLAKNLKIIKKVRDNSGAKSLLALKCFSTWSVFDVMRKYMDGTTSSSLFEVRLGHEKFGKETHAYCVAYSDAEIKEVVKYSDTIIFNSISQLKRYRSLLKNKNTGLRINPNVSYSHFDLADPARRFSRLGVTNLNDLESVLPLINGCMFHFNCENDEIGNLRKNLSIISKKYGHILKNLDWISLGGGIFFTKDGFPVDDFCRLLKDFGNTFNLQIFLEPGESAITQSTELVTTVLDIVHNEKDIAIVDASTEAHMLDLLIYRLNAKIDADSKGKYEYFVAGRSCLAGDIFGNYSFPNRLKIGSTIRFSDAGGYTMVKKNWFNGVSMPSIAVKRLNGKVEVIKKFGYADFKNSLS